MNQPWTHKLALKGHRTKTNSADARSTIIQVKVNTAKDNDLLTRGPALGMTLHYQAERHSKKTRLTFCRCLLESEGAKT